MKASWNWLLELCDLDKVPTAAEGADALTRLGLEIEALVDLGAAFAGVVVAEVVDKRPHPQSTKLNLVDVITERGGAATQVVCGAPNVPAPGRRVLWAQPGARLPGGITLGVKPVKGVDSPGMLCSETELGIGDDDDGIIVLAEGDPTPLGAPAQQALGVDDFLLDVGAPANRADVLGHLGLARELAAALAGRLVPPPALLDDDVVGEADAAGLVRVELADPDGCPRYVARVIDGVVVAPSPRKLAQRLRTVGVRPINNLVDVTNLVMFELGQPLHAFDHGAVAGGHVVVRRARAGERLVTLDGQDRELLATDLIIADPERAIALAGVMGGQHSEVGPSTRRILLESASFDPRSIRRTARRLGLLSEASARFERGVDRELAALASVRAASLIARLGGPAARVARGAVDAYPRPAARVTVPVRMARIRSLTGIDLDLAQASAALTRLGFGVDPSADGAVLAVSPPSARGDVTREVDVIEEIVRIHGYDQVPATLPALRATPPRLTSPVPDRARLVLAGAGLAEAITFGFTSHERLAALRLPAGDRRSRPITLCNPMSGEQAIMRTSLLANLLAAVARNRSHGRADVALFEVGPVFLRRGDDLRALADEPVHAAVVLTGHRRRHLGPAAPWDYFDAKGLVEHLVADLTGRAASFAARADLPSLHPGVAAVVSVDGREVGVVGELHPDCRAAAGIDAPVFVAELDLVALTGLGPLVLRSMTPIARFPSSSRDLSLLVDAAVPAARVDDLVRAAAEPLLEGFAIVEDYRDSKLPAGTKSWLWTFRYRAADRTLTDVEVDGAHEALVARLAQEIPATRR